MWHVVAQVLLIVFITVLIIRWTVILPISRTAQWMKDLRGGRVGPAPEMPKEDFLAPFSQEVVNLARSLTEARAAAEEEARLRETGESHVDARAAARRASRASCSAPCSWCPIASLTCTCTAGKISRRLVPASGLVTALEPILRACDGTWMRIGSGDADRETVDEHDRLRVPPDNPEYTLRRVWLTKEEEEGYYYGFCERRALAAVPHRPHASDIPRLRLAELSGRQSQIRRRRARGNGGRRSTRLLLVQDYHFALLPRMIKEARPDVRVAIFWHIPWPNPEAFGICPWQRELLDGLLGADLVGFHTQAHCNNFLGNGGCGARIPDRMGALCREAARTRHFGAAVPDQR